MREFWLDISQFFKVSRLHPGVMLLSHSTDLLRPGNLQ